MAWNPYQNRNKSKLGNVRISHAGMSFASKLEGAVYDFLKLRELAGEIEDVRCQVSVKLTRAEIGYRVDFRYTGSNGIRFVEAKGMETEVWLLKKKLWRYYGPSPLEIFKGDYRKIKLTEVIIPVTTESND